MEVPSQDLREAVLRKVAAEPSSVRRDVRRTNWCLALMAVGLMVAEFLLVGGIREWGAPRPLSLLVGTALGTAALAAPAAWLAAARGRSSLGRPAGLLLCVALATPAAVFVWKTLYTSLFDSGLADWPDRFGNKCLAISFTMGTIALVAWVYAKRGSDPVHPRILGAALGVAAGAAAAMLVDLWCPVGHPRHVAYGHILPMLLLGAFGLLLGARFLDLRSRRP
ncbi:MAG: NrsF family protein [Proteobacteria bacterium]|nr:NrsF family protein [Pseudomonadota bacterium]